MTPSPPRDVTRLLQTWAAHHIGRQGLGQAFPDTAAAGAG
jgi:hypothetical protein